MASIEVNNLSYIYPNTKIGLHDINFGINEGKITCLVGASGCGKSTLLRLIAGFMKPTQGVIAIDGKIVAGSPWVPAEKRQIGLVFQQHALFPHLDVASNILFGAASREALPKLLTDFHLENKAQRYPHELSGGEQQRVALARALAAKPRALLMDEPFASIDSVLRRKIRTECIDVLRQAGVTTLMVTHDAEEAMELADHIIVMDQGKLIQSGSPHDIYTYPINVAVAGLFGEINHITDPHIIYALTASSERELLLRPEALEISNAADGLYGTITHVHFRGSYNVLHVAIASNTTLKIYSYKQSYKVGNHVHIRAI
jgi:iron(III) transport system ATP-binding protein